MSVPIVRRRPRQAESLAYEVCPTVLELQLRGFLKVRDIADALNQLDEPVGGRQWSYGTVRRLIIRGANLGLCLPLRSLSEAASQRPYVHRQPRQFRMTDHAARVAASLQVDRS